MSKRQALRELKRRRMRAQNGYAWHLLDLWFAGQEDLPGRQTEYVRMARKAEYRKELVRP